MEAASAVKKTEGGAGNSSCRRRRRRGNGSSSRRRTGHACCVCGWAHYTKTLSLLQQQLWNAHSGLKMNGNCRSRRKDCWLEEFIFAKLLNRFWKLLESRKYRKALKICIV